MATKLELVERLENVQNHFNMRSSNCMNLSPQSSDYELDTQTVHCAHVPTKGTFSAASTVETPVTDRTVRLVITVDIGGGRKGDILIREGDEMRYLSCIVFNIAPYIVLHISTNKQQCSCCYVIYRAANLARVFCSEYHIPPAVIPLLTEHIKQNVSTLLFCESYVTLC